MSVKEDLFEAIIGAVALDSDWDMEELQEVIQIMLDPDSYFKYDTKCNFPPVTCIKTKQACEVQERR